ncbi:MAG: hypothetical protein KAT14_08590 [Candidatus Marinimicrobia bacterium]|nr:hypothetical protein [Candidatus Neomarinimicrobiota bacterium]
MKTKTKLESIVGKEASDAFFNMKDIIQQIEESFKDDYIAKNIKIDHLFNTTDSLKDKYSDSISLVSKIFIGANKVLSELTEKREWK